MKIEIKEIDGVPITGSPGRSKTVISKYTMNTIICKQMQMLASAPWIHRVYSSEDVFNSPKKTENSEEILLNMALGQVVSL